MKKSNEIEGLILDVEVIKQKVAESIRKPVKSLEDLEHLYRTWFCIHYNLTYKTQALDDYTLEDIIWEYYDVMFRTDPKALKEYLPPDEIDKNVEDDENWVKQMEGDDYISPEEQNKILKEAHEGLVRPESIIGPDGNPIVGEPDGLPPDIKQNFDM